MITTVKSYILRGIEAIPATIQCEISAGIGIHLVGISDKAVNECLLRAITAMNAAGYSVPGKKVVIYVKPTAYDTLSGIEGLDLPIALAMIGASGAEPLTNLDNILFAGELGLDGSVRRIPGGCSVGDAMGPAMKAALPVCTAGDARSILLREDAVYRVGTLADAVRVARGDRDADDLLEINMPYDGRDEEPGNGLVPDLPASLLRPLIVAAVSGFDLAVSGNDKALRDAAIRAYTMLSGCRATEDTKRVYSAFCGKRNRAAPIRTVYHMASLQALFGGGARLSPGLVSMATGGTLVMEDASLWPKTVAEGICNVHLDNKVTISRGSRRITYPARFRLAMTDTPERMEKALANAAPSKLHVALVDVDAAGDETVTPDDFRDACVASARTRLRRYASERVPFAEIPAKDLYRMLDEEQSRSLDSMCYILGVSAQRQSDVIRLAAAIATLDGKFLDGASLAEAVSYVPKTKKDL